MRANRYDYDVRQLSPGDAVEVFVEPDRRWEPGIFAISTAGTAFVEIRDRIQFRFEQALLMGLRRIIVSQRKGRSHALLQRRVTFYRAIR